MEIELRQVFETEDFGAEFTPGARQGSARGEIEAEEVVTSISRPRPGSVNGVHSPQQTSGRSNMLRIYHEPRRATERDLQRVIEPLASYICATDQPGDALKLALSVLFSEVRQSYRAATAQANSFAKAASN